MEDAANGGRNAAPHVIQNPITINSPVTVDMAFQSIFWGMVVVEWLPSSETRKNRDMSMSILATC